MSVRVFIGVGTNLGNREENLARADRALRASGVVAQMFWSGIYESAPVGGPADQGNFLNAVLRAETEADPGALLTSLKQTERTLGREPTVRCGPRIIDLDLLLYGDLILRSGELVLPHPRLHERRFVLQPLAALAAEVIHPVLRKTVRMLLEALPPESPGDFCAPFAEPKRAFRASWREYGVRLK